jgi:hypothetical protein
MQRACWCYNYYGLRLFKRTQIHFLIKLDQSLIWLVDYGAMETLPYC